MKQLFITQQHTPELLLFFAGLFMQKIGKLFQSFPADGVFHFEDVNIGRFGAYADNLR